MLLSIIFFLPCFISLMWAVTYAFKVKTQRQQLMMWIRFVETVYYAAYALYTLPETDYDSMVRIETVSVPFTFAMMAMEAMFLYMHLKPECRLQASHLIMLVPALVIGAIINLLYYILGFERTARMIEIADASGGIMPAEYNNEVWRLYSFFDDTFINLVALIYFIIMLIFCFRILHKDRLSLRNAFSFVFNGGQTTPSCLIAILFLVGIISLLPFAALGRTFMLDHVILSITATVVIAVCIHLTSHIEFFCNKTKSFSLHEVSHIEEAKVFAEDETAADNKNTTEVTKPSKKIQQIEKVIDLLEHQEAFRQDDLSMQTLGEMSGIGRTTLSQIISDHYNEPFRTVVNKMRIEAAKKSMLANPAATLEQIASECGFKDASSLNHKFKEIEGDTPLSWKANVQKTNNEGLTV